MNTSIIGLSQLPAVRFGASTVSTDIRVMWQAEIAMRRLEPDAALTLSDINRKFLGNRGPNNLRAILEGMVKGGVLIKGDNVNHGRNRGLRHSMGDTYKLAPSYR